MFISMFTAKAAPGAADASEKSLFSRMLNNLFRIRTMAFFVAIAVFMAFNAFYFDCILIGAISYVFGLMLQPNVAQSLAGKKDLPPTPTQSTMAKLAGKSCKQKSPPVEIVEASDLGNLVEQSMPLAPTEPTKPVKQLQTPEKPWLLSHTDKKRKKKAKEPEEPEAMTTARPQEDVAEQALQNSKSELLMPKVAKGIEFTNVRIPDAPKILLLSEEIKAPPMSDPALPSGSNLKSQCGKQKMKFIVNLLKTLQAPLPSDPLPDQPVPKVPKEESPPKKPECTPLECEICKLEEKVQDVKRLQRQMQGGTKLEGQQKEKFMKTENLERQIAEIRLLQQVAEQSDENELMSLELMNEALSFLDGERLWAKYLSPGSPPGLEANSLIDLRAKFNASAVRREDTCWCWANQGWCPRAEYCLWKHPSLSSLH